jgi:heme/copper-type cytochrome/quinol oxidase subunit 1
MLLWHIARHINNIRFWLLPPSLTRFLARRIVERGAGTLSTMNPPQIHCTKSVPIYGIAENRLVITVAPQNDICLQG